MQKAIIIIGILILLVGLFWPLAKEIPLGRLPGDISVKGEKYSFYFPIVTCIVISIILFTITLPLSAMHHDSHKNHGPMPFQKAMDKMHKDMMIKPSGNIDVDFLKGMIPHHQGAIDMSEELIKKSKDSELKAFAQKMIDAQKAEIKMMQDWLKKREKK